MTNDHGIVVAIDDKSGVNWTFGQVRRIPTSEAWSLLKEEQKAGITELFYPRLILEPNVEQVVPSAKNRTNGSLLLFNRVPKCATSMFVNLMKKLMERGSNPFGYYSWKNYWERQLNIKQEGEFLEWLVRNRNTQYQNKAPFAMDRHVYFINSQCYNVQKGWNLK